MKKQSNDVVLPLPQEIYRIHFYLLLRRSFAIWLWRLIYTYMHVFFSETERFAEVLFGWDNYYFFFFFFPIRVQREPS